MQPHVIRGIISVRASSIQYGYRKSGTHAECSPDWKHAHGNSKIEIRQRKRGIRQRRQEERNESGKKQSGQEKSPGGLIVLSHLNSSSHVSHSRQSVKKFLNIIWNSVIYKMYRLWGDLNSVVCWIVTSPEEFSIDEQLFVGIYLAFCLSCFTLRNIKK